MTKQTTAAVVPEAAVPVPGPNHNSSAQPLLPYPPPRSAAATVRSKCMHHMGVGGGWVESMRASSPTHARAAAALAAAGGVHDERYAQWMVDHPSALTNFDQLVAASKGKQIVVFLDYDGTLSPIVDDPDAAYMSDTMRRAVRSVAKHFPTAIVSGRCRDKVFEFVKLAELYYAGSHGMDIKGPATATATTRGNTKAKAKPRAVAGGGGGVLFQPATQFLPMIHQVHQALLHKTSCIPGAKVENNRFCVSVHFRRVDETSWGALAETVRSVVEEFPKLKLTQGRMVFEVRPTIKWDKGKALQFLLRSLGFADCARVLPLYIGDDRTDEDAFNVLRRRGQGVGILVSNHPKDTSASYSLQEPAEVMEFLLRLVEWERSRSLSRAGPAPSADRRRRDD